MDFSYLSKDINGKEGNRESDKIDYHGFDSYQDYYNYHKPICHIYPRLDIKGDEHLWAYLLISAIKIDPGERGLGGEAAGTLQGMRCMGCRLKYVSANGKKKMKLDLEVPELVESFRDKPGETEKDAIHRLKIEHMKHNYSVIKKAMDELNRMVAKISSRMPEGGTMEKINGLIKAVIKM